MNKIYSLAIVFLILGYSLFGQTESDFFKSNNQQTKLLDLDIKNSELNSERSTEDITFALEWSYSTKWPQYTASTSLDETHIIICYQETSSPFDLKVVVGEIIGGDTVSYGTPVTYSTYSFINEAPSVIKLDDTHFIISFKDYNNSSSGTSIIGTVSGTSITLSSEYVFNSGPTNWITSTMLDDIHFVVAYADEDNVGQGRSVVGTVSGSTISFGSEYEFEDAYHTWIFSAIALDATHVVYFYNGTYTGYEGRAIVGTISGTTITYGSKYIFEPNKLISNFSADTLSNSKFIIAYADQDSSFMGNAIVGTVDGTTITFGPNYVYNDTKTWYNSIAVMNDTNFIIAYYDRDASNHGEAILATASGTDISFGCRITFNGTHTQYISATTLDEENFVISYFDNDAKGKSIVGHVNGVSVITWTGSTDTDWNNIGNWDGSEVPTMCENVVIPNVANQPVIAASDTASCKDLRIQSGASLTLESGSSGTASLITMGLIFNNGTINIERYITNDEWHFISTPISDATAEIFLDEYLQYYDGEWNDIVDPSTSLIPAMGYSLWGISRATTYTFTGELNNGYQSILYSLLDDGWVLLGNPYPSPIDWSHLDHFIGAIYYWDPALSNFVSWNNGSGAGTQFIPAMQGFFINVAYDWNFGVSNLDRTHEGRTTYYKNETLFSDYVELQVDGNGFFDQLFLHIDNSTDETFDVQYDAYKLFSSSDAVPQLYSYAIEDKLSIDRRPQTDMIQLGFKCGEDGIYSIKINELADLETVLIEDTKTGFTYDLLKGSYQFEYNTTDDVKRFKLLFKATGVNDFQENFVNIYAVNKTIYFQSEESLTNGRILITDITGRKILTQNIENNNTINLPPDIATGIYVVSIDNGKTMLSKKVVIN